MGNSSSNDGTGLERAGSVSGERVVYIMPENAYGGTANDEIRLRDLWDTLWRGKWFIVAVTTLCAVGSVWFALASEEWYRAETLLASAGERATPSLGGQLGGLAALAGVSVGGGDTPQAIATLRSRELAREFIKDHGLVQVFFADQWDDERDTWIGGDPSRWPDVRDATKYFHDNVFSLRQDRQTGLVTLAIEWKDPDVAAAWAMDLVRRANETLRKRALQDAETNVKYLQEELAQTSLLTLQESIGRLLESELQKLMLARGNEEFAFKVIDAASPPRERARPKRSLIVVVGTMTGGMLAVLLVFFWSALRATESRAR